MNPVNWWHQEEGGEIAKERPAPPGASQPYPNLSSVPARPAAPNQEDLKKLTAALIADRTNAQHAAEGAPIADPSSPTASPALFGVGSAPPPPPVGTPAPGGAPVASGPVASASMPAVTAPPAPATPTVPATPPAPATPPPALAAAPPPAAPPSAAPRGAVQSAPLAAPTSQSAATAPTSQSAATAPPAQTAAESPPASGAATAQGNAAPGSEASPPGAAAVAMARPALPAEPPPRPSIAGAPPPPLPAQTTMPKVGAKSADIVFLQDSSNLIPAAADEVKAFATQRGNAVIGVTGYGDTASSDPSAQEAALDLALARAQSIVETLKAAGVPGDAIRVSAEASGRGASLHLLQ